MTYYFIRLKSMKLILILIVCIVFSSGQYFILNSFAQSSEESIGKAIMNSTSILFVIFVILIIPAIIIVGILWGKKKLTSKQLKFIFLGMVVFVPALIVVGLVSSVFQSDEEKAARDAEWEQDRLKEQKQRIEQSQQPQITEEQMRKNEQAMKAALKNYESPKSFEEFESATVPSGSLGTEKLKYRPYWLVGDEWDEREWLGKISKSQDCVDAVVMINEYHADTRGETIYKAWLKECVDFTE